MEEWRRLPCCAGGGWDMVGDANGLYTFSSPASKCCSSRSLSTPSTCSHHYCSIQLQLPPRARVRHSRLSSWEARLVPASTPHTRPPTRRPTHLTPQQITTPNILPSNRVYLSFLNILRNRGLPYKLLFSVALKRAAAGGWLVGRRPRVRHWSILAALFIPRDGRSLE